MVVRGFVQCGQMSGRKANAVVKPRLLRIQQCRRRLRAVAVEMTERQQKLDHEREQREPRAKSDV